MDTITNIPVSSLTYALKGQKVLERYGYKAWAGRDHNRVSGCGYQLTVRGDPEKAKDCWFSMESVWFLRTAVWRGVGERYDLF